MYFNSTTTNITIEKYTINANEKYRSHKLMNQGIGPLYVMRTCVNTLTSSLFVDKEKKDEASTKGDFYILLEGIVVH